jgi:Helicase associated domain
MLPAFWPFSKRRLETYSSIVCVLMRCTRNVRNAKKHGTLAEERTSRLDALAFCWTVQPPTTALWKQRINGLKAFQQEHGHCKVPATYPPNPALGRWVANTRHRKKRGELDEERIRCLNALGFRSEQRVTWEQHIRDLKAFKKKHGHCDVPLRYPLNRSLANWVNGVRQSKKHGTLAEERIRLLDTLGFSWMTKRPAILVSWEQRINELKAFKQEHGHCNVPSNYQPNPTLGRWITNLRQRKKRGELGEDKILLLDSLGFCWARYEKPNLLKKLFGPFEMTSKRQMK